MKILLVSQVIGIVCMGHSGTAPGSATDTLVVSSAMTINNDTSVANIRVTSTGNLTANGILNVSGNMVVDPGGVVTHTLRQINGLRLNISGTLEIKTGGTVNVSAKGLRGGKNGSIYDFRGEAIDPVTGNIIAGSYGGNNTAAGGSYGGRGCNGQGFAANEPYGLLENPVYPGSGGGGTNWTYCCNPGGHGGGVVRIIAGQVIVNGTIQANGGDGVAGDWKGSAGAGSGGSIFIQASTLNGNGSIFAWGGNGQSDAAMRAGGGGRIAIYTDNNSFPSSNISCAGGFAYTADYQGAAGTVYLKTNSQPSGDVLVDNANRSSLVYSSIRSGLTTFHSLTVNNKGKIQVTGAELTNFSVELPVSVKNSSTLWLMTGVTMNVTNSSGFDLIVESESTLQFDPGSGFSATSLKVSGATVISGINLAFSGAADLDISGTSYITINNNSTLATSVFDSTNIKGGTINIAYGSKLDVSINTIVIGSGVTLIKDGKHGTGDSIGNLTVMNGGVITHSQRLLSGLRLKVTGTLDIRSGGSVNANAKGLSGGKNGSVFDFRGEAIDPLTGNIIPGANGGNNTAAGGSYGGKGCNGSGFYTNEPYGYLENPVYPGSGGGGTNWTYCCSPGGHGGGMIKILAGQLLVNGSIQASGGDGGTGNTTGYSGGGSGGSVFIEASEIGGAGSIQARGGNGPSLAELRAGGGGRIAIYSDINTFPVGNISAAGGAAYTENNQGASGTIFLKKNSESTGDIVVENAGRNALSYGSIRSNLTAFRSMTINNKGKIQILPTDFSLVTIQKPVIISNASILSLTSGVTMNITNNSGSDIKCQSGSTLQLDAGSFLNANSMDIESATLKSYISLSFPSGNDLSVSGASTFHIYNNSCLTTGTFDTTNIKGGTINIAYGSRLDVAGNTITVGSGVTLIKDGKFGTGDSIGNLTVMPGGVITHSQRLLSGLRLKVTGAMDIRSGGSVHANAKGLSGGKNGSVFDFRGEAIDPVTGNIVAGANGGNNIAAGGSYGGKGCNGSGFYTNEPYGYLENPVYPGSGGGGTNWTYCCSPGGHGGGLIRIAAGQLLVNGSIQASGGDGGTGNTTGYSGGGSGGSVFIEASEIGGAGSIQARGGNGPYLAELRAGGGGRIAIYSDINTFPVGNISAAGGAAFTDNNQGASGTIFLKKNSESTGDIVVENAGRNSLIYSSIRSNLTTFRSMIINNKGKILIMPTDLTHVTFQKPVTISNASILWLTSGVTMDITNTSGTDINCQSGSTLQLDAGSLLNANSMAIHSAVVKTYISLSFPSGNDLTISGVSNLHIYNNSILTTGSFDTTNIKGGTINIPFGSRLDVLSNSIEISGGVSLIKDGKFGTGDSIGNLTLHNGGMITCSQRLLSGLRLKVLGFLDIRSGGSVNVDAKGLSGGKNGSVFDFRGEAIDPVTGTIIAGANGGYNTAAGGSYGGKGCNGAGFVTNEPYGLLENPIYPGSGGGGTNWSYCCSPGGHGGGLVRIHAEQLQVNGTIQANGGNGQTGDWTGFSGGGSGGSVFIDATEISGAGYIQARGGNGPTHADLRAGGGGRIAIFSDSSMFNVDHISVAGGSALTTNNQGSAGTIYLKQNAHPTGDVVVENANRSSLSHTPLFTNLTQFRSLKVNNKGIIHLRPENISNLSIERPVIVSNNSFLRIFTGVSMILGNATGADLMVESGSATTLEAGTILNADAVKLSSGTLSSSIGFSFPDASNLDMSGDSYFNLYNNSALILGAFDSTNIKGGTMNISFGSRLEVLSHSIMINSGVTLVKDGKFGTGDSIGNLTIKQGGQITHSQRLISGLRLKVSGLLNIRTGGSINVSAKGLSGGKNGSSFDYRGEAIDPVTGSIIAGAQGGNYAAAGGSYGGKGCNGQGFVTNVPYGVLENPVYPGSGGGGTDWTYCCTPGGHGGGLVRIIAEQLIVNGTIHADGGDGQTGDWSGYSGGGSGGSVYIQAGSVSGSGFIFSRGGNGTNHSELRAGGGGRIAIFADENLFPVANISAAGGSAATINYQGSAGSLFIKINAQVKGDLYVNNANRSTLLGAPLKTSLLSFRKMKISQAGSLEIPLNSPLNSDTVMLDNGKLITGDTITLQSGVLAGSGSVAGHLKNNGFICPGPVAGGITVTGSYTQTPFGSLNSRIAYKLQGSGFQQLNITGNASLSGTLNVTLVNNYIPAIGDTFSIVTHGTRTGEFSTVTGWDNYKILYRNNRITLKRELIPMPNMVVTPLSLYDSLLPGQNSLKQIHLNNNGEANLSFTATENEPWISVTPSSGTLAPGLQTNLEVAFSAAGLNPGNYFTTITISGNDPANPSINVPVYFTVVAPVSVQAIATPSVICSGSLINLEATPAGGFNSYSFTWSSDPPGFSSSLQNPWVNPLVNTTYFVTVDDGHTTATTSVPVTVFQNSPPPAVTPLLPADSNYSVSSPVQFSWEPAANATVYDLYIWRTTLPKPGTPTMAGIGQPNAVYNGYLSANYLYYWQVHSKNYCSPTTTPGPVRIFSFNPFSDLTVENIQIPDTALAGQGFEISFDIRNSGPGATGIVGWNDQVFLSPTPSFNSATAILAGTLTGINPLGNGEHYTQTQILPAGINLSGSYYIFIITDAGNSIVETDENNNKVMSAGALFVKLPPYPDLLVRDVTALCSQVVPDSLFSVGWIVENVGEKEAIGGWSQKVTLIAQNKRITLGYLQTTEPLGTGGIISGNAVFSIPKSLGVEGSALIEVVLTPYPVLIEKPNATANNTSVTALPTPIIKRLFVVPSLSSIPENNFNPVNCTLIRSGDPSVATTAILQASEPNRITMPLSILVPANQSATTFQFTPIDNTMLEGDKSLTISATSADYQAGSAQINIVDDETPSFQITMSKKQATEGDTVKVTVTRNLVLNSPVILTLSSGNPSQITIPSTATILPGQASVFFNMMVINDNIMELTQDVIITVSSSGFSPQKDTVTVIDNDIPQIQFTISPDTVSEASGIYAAIGTIRRVVPGTSANEIRFSASQNGILILPQELSLPANTIMKQFNVGVVDNLLVDPIRTINVTAAVYLPACGCNAPPVSSGSATCQLTVLDDDGPALSLAAVPNVVPEGVSNGGTLKVSRNTPGGPALPVTLYHTSPDELNIPSQVTIPEGQSFVSVPIATIDDSVSDGDQLVPVSASASGFSGGTSWIIVTDRNIPDLVIHEFQVQPGNLYIGNELPFSVTLKNNGFSTAAYGVTVNVYLSNDNIFSKNDLLLASKPTISAIVPEGFLPISDTLIIPPYLGNYWLFAVVNNDQGINELIYFNNSSEPKPVSILPDYTAYVSVDGDVFNGNNPITISGFATRFNAQPAVNKDVDVYIILNDLRRVEKARTNASGYFSTTFQPINGEAGHYDVGACFPGQGLNTVQDQFTVLGMKHTSGIITWNTVLGEEINGSLPVKNLSSLDLSGVDVSIVSAPPGCDLTFSSGGSISGDATVDIGYHLTATTLSVGNYYLPVKLRILSNEGADYDFDAWFYCTSPVGFLQTTPVSLVSTMVKGQSTLKEYQIKNIGKGNSGLIRTLLPQVPWMKLASPDSILTIPPNGTAVTTIRLTPTDELPLNTPISGTIAINSANANALALPYSFETISNETGDLAVDVMDEYSYYGSSGAHVDSATVILKHPYTGVVITQGMTGQNGIFNATSIPEGYYTLVVQAIRHEGYQNTIFIEKGKVNEKAVFLSFQSISWSWNVVPTEIPDKYEINLIVEFETNVPAPVILMDIPDTMPYLEANQQFPFLITVSNQGLITAHDFELTLPEDDEYEFEAMLNKIDILPQQSVQIPAVMKRRASRQFSFSHNCIEFMFGTYIYICGEDRKKTTADNTRYQFRYCIGESGYEPVPPIVSPSWTFCPTCPPEGPGGPMFTGEGPEPSDLAPTIEIPVLDSLNDCDSCVLKILWWILRCPCTAHYACRAARVVDCVVDVYGECENNWASIGCMTGLKDCDGSPDSQCWLELFDICKSNNKNNGIFLSFLPPIQEKMKIPYREETAKKGYNLELFGDTAWADAPKIEFNYFNDYFNSLSPAGGVTLTPELTDHRPSNISENQVALFVARWNNTMNLLNGLPYDSSNVMDADTLEMYGEIIDSCENASKLLGYPNTSELIYYQLDSLQYYANKKQNSVCAKVSLKFSQNLTMTREAFDGTLTIYNGHETLPIQNVLLDLKIYDETGSIRNDLFQINTISLNELTGIDGSGSLNAMKNGMALIRFIPEKGAAPTLPKSYSFGGTLSYLDPFTGESVNRPLFPVTLTVNPSPDLYLDYFLQRDILGDDALTPESEPSIPAELAVMIQNQGYGIAKNVKLESAQPVITDNEKGLLIEFEIIGSNLGGKPRQLGLYNVNFGNIQPNGIGIGQWWFTSSLLGHFISYDATVNHLDSYGNPDLSLVSSVEIHELIRSVTAYGALYDTISDFLVNDFTDAMDFPDRLYFSNGTDDMVRIATEATVDGPVAVDDTIIHLTVDPSAAGWNYARTEDPGNGQYTICSVTRNDGQVIPLTNVWLTYCTIPDGGEPVYENKLHFLDLFPSGDTAGYNIVFTPVDQGAPRVTRISGIPEGVADLPVDSAVVVFSEPIDSATFTYQDMILRCQGGPNLMDSAVIITKLNDTSYHVNMAGKTNQSGYYTLTVQASGINDLAGNPGTIGKQIAWIQAFDVPAIEMFTGIPDTPGEPVDSVGILFNMPIITSTFTTDKVMLVKNETDTIFPDNILITPADTLHRLFTVSGLSTYNPDDASYRLIINVISIQGENQSWGLLNQSATWIVCQNNPPFAFAGIDDTICAGESFPLSGTVQNQQSFSWTSDGNGYFMNSGTLTPVYLPNETDKITGHVTITLSAFPLNGCSEPVLSSLYLKINKAPFVLAGPDDTIGYGEAFPLIHAIAADYTGLQWSATGSGSFNNPGILHPVYQPSPDDTGHIMLTLTAQGNLPCEPVAASLSLYVRPPDQVVFDVRVLLEGAFTPSTVQMHTRLNELGLIPTMQPYAGEPWNYPGTESFAVLPPNITDWVLVELRDAGTPDSATGSTILPGWPRAMFISSDGTLTDLTGNQPQIDLPSFSKQLFVVIKHRNHIGVMSSSGMLRLGNTLSFDFTTSIQQAFGGGDGYKQIGSNPPRFGMVAGNADGDNNIYISDLNYWMADFGKTMIYSGTDIDLDGNTFISDFNIWAGNFGYISISGTVQPGPRYRSGIPE